MQSLQHSSKPCFVREKDKVYWCIAHFTPNWTISYKLLITFNAFRVQWWFALLCNKRTITVVRFALKCATNHSHFPILVCQIVEDPFSIKSSRCFNTHLSQLNTAHGSWFRSSILFDFYLYFCFNLPMNTYQYTGLNVCMYSH